MLVGKKLGSFQVDKELGAGAMGAVYRAVHEKTGQKVAVKLIAAALANNDSALARFEREVAILKQLDHPNITKYLGSGRWRHDSGRPQEVRSRPIPFYLMEYIEGESLDHIVERRQRLGWEEVIAIGQQLCAALQHAHDKGIIHRDLKPGNLMVLPDGTVKLTDFGIAKDTDVTALTAANSTLGTASYMSPEQCKGARDLTAKSDLYSMGIMFYELLTGKKPFSADNVMEMFRLHTQVNVERPSRWVLEIPIWFDSLICELLEKDPARRPLNADAVAKALVTIKEKMLAQASAGMEAATKRRVDRSAHDLRLSDIDKDLARALLGKKKKKKAVPVYRQTWFTVSTLAGIALGLVLLVWYVFFTAPSAETLVARAQTLMQSSELKDRRQAREGPIETFLSHYPHHSEAAKMAQWRDQVDSEFGVFQLKNRRRLQFPPDGDSEKAAFDALDDEEAGKLDESEKRWLILATLKNDSAKERRVWGLVAESYLQDLKGVKDLGRDLLKKINEEKTFEKKHEGGTKEEQLALGALRDEDNMKVAEARKQWEELKEATKSRPEMRRWHLLASRKIRDLPK